ncbi:hypothetical protein [Bacillus smithii]|uniref:hypothetical protein n=1 Tax=Bacillus smithii TaxID=1479 RepID=UPI0030C91786
MEEKNYVTIGKISHMKFDGKKIQIRVASLSEYSINTNTISDKGIYNVWILTKDEENQKDNQKVDQNKKDDLCCKVKRQNKWYKVSNEGMENYLADLIYTLYKNQNIVKLTLSNEDDSKVIAIELGGEYEKQL